MREPLVPDGEDAAISCGIDGTVVDDGENNDSSSSISYAYCTTPITTKPVLPAWTCTLILIPQSIIWATVYCTYSWSVPIKNGGTTVDWDVGTVRPDTRISKGTY